MQFWRLTFGDAGLGAPVVGTYDPMLVAISVAVACLGGFAAFAISDRIQQTSIASRRVRWQAAGSFAMGGGIWAMHFTGMLAFSMPIRVTYDLPMTLLSIVPGLIGSGVALHTMARPFAGWRLQQARALAMAAGIGCMHYTGMEAMRMSGDLHYDGVLFLVSIGVAHVLSTIALYLKQFFSNMIASGWLSSRGAAITERLRPIAPIVMGCAVAGMHYTAMAASRFYARPGFESDHGGLELPPTEMALGILVIGFAITGCALVAVRIDKWLEETAAALLDTKVRERTVLDSMVDGVLSVDGDARVESANPAAKRMFGVEDEEIGGKLVDDLLPGVSDLAEAGGDGAGREMMARRRDGSELPTEVTVAAYESEGKRFLSIIVRDISRRKRAEQQLRQSQKLESIGQLAAGIAHEINTPTQYLSDNVCFLRDSFGQLGSLFELQKSLLSTAQERKLESEEGEKLQSACENADLEFLLEETPRSIEESLEGLERIASIVRSLKEFSHPDSEEMTRADLNRALASTVTVARNEWKYCAEVVTEFDAELPPVKCHLGDVNQVFLNLIVNAAQAIAGAGNASPETGRIKITSKVDGAWAEVRVQDNGPGIPAEVRDRIFDPFFTTKDMGSGTGQGLAIAHGIIVAKHGGSITVQSEPGQGATFAIRLPIDGPPSGGELVEAGRETLHA